MKKLTNKGFSLIELVIAGAIIAIAFTGISGFLLFSRSTTIKSAKNTEALGLAEQAVEAVRKLRDDGWTANIAPLTAGTVYYPVISGNEWTLSTTAPGGTYTTTVVLSNVARDGSDNISSSGTNDDDTKKVVAKVTWTDNGTHKVELTTYITNFNND